MGQSGLAVTCLTISLLPDPLDNMVWLRTFGFCLSVFITFQDIATDALVIEIVVTGVLAFSESMWNQSYFIEGYMLVFNTLFTFAAVWPRL